MINTTDSRQANQNNSLENTYISTVNDTQRYTSMLINSRNASAQTREVLRKIDKLLNNNEKTSFIVNGIDETFNTHEYAKDLKRAISESAIAPAIMFENKIDIAADKIERFDPSTIPVETLAQLLKVQKKSKDLFKSAFKDILPSVIREAGNSTIAYNRLVATINWINKYYNNTGSENTQFVFYGKPNKNEMTFINILIHAGMPVIVLNPTDEFININTDEVIVIDLEDSGNLEDLDNYHTSTTATVAYKASKKIEKDLFSGSTVGLYKPGIITKATTKKLECIYEEIINFWNKDMYLRPGFKQSGNEVELPVIFGLVKGVPEDFSDNDYLRQINQFAFDDTKIYYNGDFALDSLKEGKAYIVSTTKDIDSISSMSTEDVVNTKLSFLDRKVRDRFIKAATEISKDDRFKKMMNCSERELVKALNVMIVTLSRETVNLIQGYDLVSANPNIIVICTDSSTIQSVSALYLALMHKLNFDILVFVPTCYSSIDDCIPEDYFTEYTLGKPRLTLNEAAARYKVTLRANRDEALKASKPKKGLFGWFKK